MPKPEDTAKRPPPFRVSKDRLLVRPNSKAGEHAIGYLLRLAHLNGLATHKSLETSGATLETRKGYGRARWCPHCLGQAAAIWREEWDKSFAICVAHQCWLVDRCVACERDATWADLRMFTCRCGHALTSAVAPALSRELVGLLSDEVPEVEADKSWIRLARDEKLSLLRFIGALDVYGLTGKPLKRASISSAHAESRLIEAGAAIKSGGRRAILALLDRIRAMPSAICAVQTMNEAFPRLTKLISLLPSRSTRAWVEEQLATYLEDTSAGDTAVTWRRNDQHRHGSARDCANQMRMRPTGVATVCSHFGIEPKIRHTKSGRRVLVLSKHDFAQVRQRMRNLVSQKTVAACYGISVKRQQQLMAAGWIKSIRGSVDASSVVLLLSRLIQGASDRSHVGDGDYISLCDTLRFHVPVSKTVDFFAALLDGEMEISCGAGKAVPNNHASDIYLSASQVRKWKEGLSSVTTRVTIMDAAKRMNIKEQVMYHLVNVGLIRVVAVRCSGRAVRLVELAELDRFRATYEPLALAAKREQVDFRGALAWARRAGISIVSGPSVDGGRQYFVLKDNQ